jgi:hypothetical protein
MYGGELDAVDGGVFGAAQAPFISELQRGGLAFGQRRIEAEPHGGILLLRVLLIWAPLASTTRETVSALFNSKESALPLLSRGTKRTSAVAMRAWVAGWISASMV